MVRWLILGAVLVLLVAAVWAYARITKHGPDKAWSDRQDDGHRQIQRSNTGL